MALPMEIWTKICSLACTDDGRSGRALSLVSSYMNEASRSVKLQSVKVVGVDQIMAFASMLENIPPSHRRVRHLFLSSRDLRAFTPIDHEQPRTNIKGTYDGGVREGRRPEVQEDLNTSILRSPPQSLYGAYFRILSAVSPSLETLYVFFTFPDGRSHIFPPVHLPSLTALSLYGPADTVPGFDRPNRLGPHGQCPSLRRLALGGLQNYPDDLFGAIASMAPSLTHLRLIGPDDPRMFYDLQTAMGRVPQPFLPAVAREVPRLPPSMERVWVGADVRRGPKADFRLAELACITMLDILKEVSKEDERIVVGRQPKSVYSLYDEAEMAWRDGGVAYWSSGRAGVASCLESEYTARFE